MVLYRFNTFQAGQEGFVEDIHYCVALSKSITQLLWVGPSSTNPSGYGLCHWSLMAESCLNETVGQLLQSFRASVSSYVRREQ